MNISALQITANFVIVKKIIIQNNALKKIPKYWAIFYIVSVCYRFVNKYPLDFPVKPP